MINKTVESLFLMMLLCLPIHAADMTNRDSEDINHLISYMDRVLERGGRLSPSELIYFNFEALQDPLRRLSSQEFAAPVHGYTFKWLDKYSDQFDELPFLHLLGGGNAADLLPYYESSTNLWFKRNCLLSFCLNKIPVEPEKNKKIVHQFPLDVTARLLAEKTNEWVHLRLELINNGGKCLLYSDDDLRPNIEIRRKDGVPILYSGSLLFQNSGVDPKWSTEYFGSPGSFNMTYLPQHSMLIRNEIMRLEKKKRTEDLSEGRVLIKDIYLKKYGNWYTLFGNTVSGEIKESLELELRYVYDSRILSDSLVEKGIINPPRTLPNGTHIPVYNFRIESNPVTFIFGRDGQLLDVFNGKQ